MTRRGVFCPQLPLSAIEFSPSRVAVPPSRLFTSDFFFSFFNIANRSSDSDSNTDHHQVSPPLVLQKKKKKNRLISHRDPCRGTLFKSDGVCRPFSFLLSRGLKEDKKKKKTRVRIIHPAGFFFGGELFISFVRSFLFDQCPARSNMYKCILVLRVVLFSHRKDNSRLFFFYFRLSDSCIVCALCLESEKYEDEMHAYSYNSICHLDTFSNSLCLIVVVFFFKWIEKPRGFLTVLIIIGFVSLHACSPHHKNYPALCLQDIV